MHVGLGKKAARRNAEQLAGRVTHLDQQAQYPVVFVVRGRDESPRHLQLESHHNSRRTIPGLRQLHQDWRRHRIGQISDQFPIAPVPLVFLKPVQSVRLQQRELGMGCKPFVQNRHQSGILFNGQHLIRLRQQQLRQGPESGADLEYIVRWRQRPGFDDPLELIGVVQKILSQRLRELDVAFLQPAAHFS